MTTQTIEIAKSTITQLTHYPGEKEPTHVLVLHAPLTQELAKALKCDQIAFDLNDQPRKFEGKIGLVHELADIDIRFSGFMGNVETIAPTKAWKFRIGHDNSDRMGVDYRLHFKGDSEHAILDNLLVAVNSKEFDLAIVSRQGELFPEKMTGDGNDGTRVEMSQGPADPDDDDAEAECIHCDKGTPLTEAGDYHADGMPCPLAQRRAAVTDDAPLASAQNMGAKRGRPRKQRDPEAERKAQSEAGRYQIVSQEGVEIEESDLVTH